MSFIWTRLWCEHDCFCIQTLKHSRFKCLRRFLKINFFWLFKTAFRTLKTNLKKFPTCSVDLLFSFYWNSNYKSKWKSYWHFAWKIQIVLKRRMKIRTPKVPFNFCFKILMKKTIFVYFNFDSKFKIEKRDFFFNFQFSVFIRKFKNKIFDFRFSIFILFQNINLGGHYTYQINRNMS